MSEVVWFTVAMLALFIFLVAAFYIAEIWGEAKRLNKEERHDS